MSVASCSANRDATTNSVPPPSEIPVWTPPEQGADGPSTAESPLGARPEAPPPISPTPPLTPVPSAPAAGGDTPRKAIKPGARSSLGVNIAGVSYYAQQVMFLDLMYQAADWGLNSGGLMPVVDAHGYPKALKPGHRAGFVANAGKGGRYVILYEGAGEISVSHGGNKVSSEPGRDVIALDSGQVSFTIERTDPKNPLRNIHIVPVQNEHDHQQQIFDPKFLDLVRPFSVLRFMDYAHTNGAIDQRWDRRAKPDDFSQGTIRGGSIEYAIELCNRVKADCWLNIPHMADDDYIKHYAELVSDKLDPSLRAYVEYSNEVWNFEHGDWIQKAGERAGLPHEWDTRLRYQARRSVQIFNAFEKALGKKRLVRVLAGQMWSLRLQILFDFEEAYRHADVMAVAPYFGGELAGDESVPVLRTKTPEQVVAMCAEEVEKQRALLKELKALADHYKLPMIGYEGGQHLVSGGAFHDDDKLQGLLDAANRLPAMGKVYTKYLENWRDEGGQIMALYTLVDAYSKWGRWGLLESMWQPAGAAPKYMATLAFLQRQPRWWDERDASRGD